MGDFAALGDGIFQVEECLGGWECAAGPWGLTGSVGTGERQSNGSGP